MDAILQSLSSRRALGNIETQRCRNRRLIEAPVDVINYVITHELCRIAETRHGTAFFDLLGRDMPD